MQRPSGVIRAILTLCRSLPVYPDKQTIQEPVGTSHSCHGRNSAERALQATFFDHKNARKLGVKPQPDEVGKSGMSYVKI
jgi:hypothetical protein